MKCPRIIFCSNQIFRFYFKKWLFLLHISGLDIRDVYYVLTQKNIYKKVLQNQKKDYIL